MNERYSYRIVFGLKNGKERELLFEDETEAEEAFAEQADEWDCDLAEKYDYASLYKVDWHYRAEYELNSVSF